MRFYVLDAEGRRVFPALRPRPPPPTFHEETPALVGGVAGACLAHRPAVLVEAAAALAAKDREAAVRLLERASREARAEPVRAAALFDFARLQHAAGTLPGSLNAREAYGTLAGLPIGLVDARGRCAPAQARFDLAREHRLLGNRAAYLGALTRLLGELEEEHPRLPPDVVADLAERAGELLELEGEGAGALARARALSERRRHLAEVHSRLDDLFGRHLERVLHEAAAAGGGPTGFEAPFVKERTRDDYELLTYALLPGQDRQGRPTGLVAFQLDPAAVPAALRDRVALVPGAELVPGDAEREPYGERDPDVQEVALRAPLEHLAVRVHASSAEPTLMEDSLNLPRDTVRLWMIALSIGGILAGVLVTTRTVLREAKAAQLKSDFVSNVTHELKTPLTSIRMFLETLMLGRVTDEEEAQECLQVMARESERLTRLIEKLLVFSRIESRKWRLRLAFEPPKALVDEALRILADQLGGKSPEELGIEVVAVQDLPQIAVDRFAVVEAVLNLLQNAWKYSSKGDRRVRVVVTSRRRHVEVAVEDNGIGVPRRDRRRIFVKFERGSNAEKGRIEGSGIGLTLANSIVRAHGGWIKYAALKPNGSRFSVFLPK